MFSDCKNCLEDDRFKEIITNLFGKIIHLNNSDNYTVYFDGKESKRIDDYSEDEEISENILSLIKGGIND